MASVQDESRMLRKQYHLSAHHVRRIQTLRAGLGLGSDAELIRRAIDTFDPDALNASERELVEATAEDLLRRVETLNADIEQTLERARTAREQINDPAWTLRIRERVRREAEADSALVAGVARLIGA